MKACENVPLYPTFSDDNYEKSAKFHSLEPERGFLPFKETAKVSSAGLIRLLKSSDDLVGLSAPARAQDSPSAIRRVSCGKRLELHTVHQSYDAILFFDNFKGISVCRFLRQFSFFPKEYTISRNAFRQGGNLHSHMYNKYSCCFVKIVCPPTFFFLPALSKLSVIVSDRHALDAGLF